MHFPYSSVPEDREECHNQVELSDISDEEFDAQWKDQKFTWYHRIFQFVCFILLFGAVRVVFSLTCFVAMVAFVTFFRLIQLKLGINRKYFKGFLHSTLQVSIRFLNLAFGHVHVKVNGELDPETRIIITNHTAFHDPFMISYLVKVGIVCKKELSDSILKYMLDVVDPIYVRRDMPGGQTKMIIEQANNVNNHPVLIFPEGTLTNGGITLKFHKGAFLTDKKVQPMLIRYNMPFVPKGWNSYAWTQTNTLEYIWNCVSMPFNIVTVTILPPMTVSECGGTPEAFAKFAQLKVANFFGTKAVTRSSDEIFRQRKEAKSKEEAKKKVE